MMQSRELLTDSAGAIDTLTTRTTSATEHIIQSVSQVLDELGIRFGATGAHLWGELVRWEFWHALGVLGVGFIPLLVGLPVCLWCFHQEHKCGIEGGSSTTQENYTVGIIVSGIVTIVGLAIIIVSFAGTLAALMAPEAAALKSLLP